MQTAFLKALLATAAVALLACDNTQPLIIDEETARASDYAVLEARRTGGTVFIEYAEGIASFAGANCEPLADASSFIVGDHGPACGTWVSSRMVAAGEATSLYYPPTLTEEDLLVPMLIRGQAVPRDVPALVVAEFIELPMGTTCSSSTRYLYGVDYYGGGSSKLSIAEAIGRLEESGGPEGEVEVHGAAHLVRACD